MEKIIRALEIKGVKYAVREDGLIAADLPDGQVIYDGATFEIVEVVPSSGSELSEESLVLAMTAKNMAKAPPIARPVIIAVRGGFYFFGDWVNPPKNGKVDEDFVILANGAMFGGYAGGKGLPGVARGDAAATVTLDRFGEGQLIQSPMHSGATLAVMDSINLYQFKGTTLR